mmetsp:Transcript_2065/g.4756  ORF Transcript_2065/g.4756 Transcript_2065/m.4756 type:complete len:92 (-) Transcript_2065:102-377(-)
MMRRPVSSLPIKRPSGSTLMVPLLAERMKRDKAIDHTVEKIPPGTVDTIARKLKGDGSLAKQKRADMFDDMGSKLCRELGRRAGRIARSAI